MSEYRESALKRSRILYIFEAMFEYLISILVSGSFLATITKQLGLSDSLTGILSSIVSLGCLFQLISLSIRKTRVKGLVVVLSISNQILFMLLYVIPLLGVARPIKSALFVVCIILAYFLYNLAHPKKINWLMSLVDDKKRGDFTATKEILSLVAGMLFSFGMGALIDHFIENGRIRIAFCITAAVIFVLTVIHSLTMLFAVEKPIAVGPSKKFTDSMRDVFKNKKVLQVSVVFILYHLSSGISTPFYGTYQIGELGFSLKLVTAISMCGSIARIFVSKLWGKYADRHSFAKMIQYCFVILAVAQTFMVFTVPSSGVYTYTAYAVCYGIAMGGINSALINLIFDYAPPETRADSLAITLALSGLAGFVATLCAGPLVAFIQQNGNALFGIPIYAQQAVTVIGLLFTVVAIFYVQKVLVRKP